MDKFDLILQEIRNINSKLEQMDKHFEQIENRFDTVINRLDAIESRLDAVESRLDAVESRLETVENRLETVENRLDAVESRLDAMDTRITSLKADNLEDHNKIYKLLNSLNASFLRFEAEFNDKIRILFDGYADLQNHKIITSHEITVINDKIANLSFRVSKLENS